MPIGKDGGDVMENKKRLIDANAHIAEVCKSCGHGCELDKECCILVDDLMAAPTVDAVEVVRCEKCYYWDKATVNSKGFLICPASGMDITPNDFCSYGERKDDT